MANPTGLTVFPETEYVELYNASGMAISLNGWSFVYDGKATVLPDTLLPAGGYAVLFRAGREIFVESSGIAVPVATFPASLANTGKTLQLTNTAGTVIDAMDYAAAQAGRSWERDPEGNLYLSNDVRGGTPGAANSPAETTPPVTPVPDTSQPGDVLFNEVMANPTGLTDFPETEYVELYNASGTAISLNGWSFVYDGKATLLPDTLLPAGGYAVLFRAGREIFVESSGIAVPVATFPASLANTGKTLQLTNTTGTVIDFMDYAAAQAGRSWERDPEGNLYLSNDVRGGTPGAINSPAEITPPVIPVPDTSQPGDVLINEVMANPTGVAGFPETEYVELYNASGTAVSLNGWSFVYDGKATVLPDTLLPAGGYAVLFRAGREIFVESSGIALPVATFPASLANTGKTLQLTNTVGTVIDSMDYAAAQAGRSWERDPEGNLYLSNDIRGGTPGAINSPAEIIPPVTPVPDTSQPGDVLINEVMANPAGLIAFPETEYVELYNASGTAISLNGWSLVYDGKATVLPDTLLPAGGYAVLFRAGREIFVESSGIAVPVATFPSSLANTGKTLHLVNTGGTVIDSMDYAAAQAGRSWERDPEGNLYLSNDVRGGTPGAANSPAETAPPVTPVPDTSQPGDVLINEVMANPTGLTGFPETEYVELYNASGTAISLNGWSFVYDGKATLLPDTLLPAGGYAVLFRAGREIFVESSGIALPVATFPASLANTGKTLQLTNTAGTVIDAMDYAAAQAGRSWERDPEGNLYLSNDVRGGTPGAANSPAEITPPVTPVPDTSQPGDVLINEVMANPTGVAGFPETEYVELYNASGTAVSLNGWSLVYDGKATLLPDTLLPAGGYAVLFRAGREIFVESSGIALPVATFPASLANTGKTLQLTNTVGTVIDSMDYAAAQAGRSWERDPAGNLYLSNDVRGGTPGAANSPAEITPPVTPVPDTSQPGDVLLNEIMANPTGVTAFPETEYVELYNASGTAVSLNGWSLVYDGKATVLPDTLLPAGGYAVLFRAGREIFVESSGIALPVATFPASLANTGKTLQLTNTAGTVIDAMDYAAAQAGRSWERDPEGNLYLSNDVRGGTPGAANSPVESPNGKIPEEDLIVDEKEFVFNELLPEPFINGDEYIELYNRSGRPLYLAGLSVAVRKADGTLSTRYALSSITNVIPPDEYAVLTGNRNGVSDFYYTPSPQVICELKLPALNNTGATLVLFRTKDETVIDEVSYSPEWHDVAIKNTKGVSLERIYPEQETQSSVNWTSATSMAGYGTPGYKNSQYGASEAGHAISLSAPEYVAGSGEYLIHFRTDQTGYRCRMDVFTPEGKKVAEISNNRLVGREGEIQWNGNGLDGGRLRAGIYIFFAEFYHPDGQRKSFRKVFPVKQ
jgi:hypothetical protein